MYYVFTLSLVVAITL